jgi:transposase
MDTLAVERYVIQVLGPTLRPGQIVILDNLSVHKPERIRAAIAARGGELVFLPAYSPDFTPIEQAFSKIKAILRGLGARVRAALLDAIGLAVSAITSADAYAWFLYAGYSLPVTSS